MIANTAKWEKYDTFPDHDFQIIRKTMAAADIFLLGSQHNRAVNRPSRSFTLPVEGFKDILVGLMIFGDKCLLSVFKCP